MIGPQPTKGYKHQNHLSRFNRTEVMRHNAEKNPELAAIFDFWHTRIFEASMLIPHTILALV